MIHLPEKDRKLIEWINSLGRVDGKLPLDLDKVLDLLARQQKVIEKAVQQRNYYWAGQDEKSFFGGLDSDDRDLQKLMNGEE